MARNKPITDAELYKFHVENLRSIDRAIGQVELLAKEAIRKDRLPMIDALLRTHLLLLGAWTECRLKKLLYEQNGFNAAEREAVRAKGTQLERWATTIDIGFKRRYGVENFSINTLRHTAFNRYAALQSALSNDIGPVIELRNKLAHGQWYYLLTNDEDAIAQKAMAQINTSNLLSSKFKLQIVGFIANLVHDLVVSTAFERDFDDHFEKFMNAHTNLKNRNYGDYVQQLKDRHRRGQLRR